MKPIVEFDNVPDSSIILKDFGKVDYCDSFQLQKRTNDSIDKITTNAFKMPGWVNFLMKIRNSIVGIFGLKTDFKNGKNLLFQNPTDSKSALFNVINRNDNEIVMGENDKHLNFRLSVLIIRKESLSEIYLTTIVKFNNIWGRLYFLPVKPFHKIIVKSLLKKI